MDIFYKSSFFFCKEYGGDGGGVKVNFSTSLL